MFFAHLRATKGTLSRSEVGKKGGGVPGWGATPRADATLAAERPADDQTQGPGAVSVSTAAGGGVSACWGDRALPFTQSLHGIDQSPPWASVSGGPPV